MYGDRTEYGDSSLRTTGRRGMQPNTTTTSVAQRNKWGNHSHNLHNNATQTTTTTSTVQLRGAVALNLRANNKKCVNRTADNIGRRFVKVATRPEREISMVTRPNNFEESVAIPLLENGAILNNNEKSREDTMTTNFMSILVPQPEESVSA